MCFTAGWRKYVCIETDVCFLKRTPNQKKPQKLTKPRCMFNVSCAGRPFILYIEMATRWTAAEAPDQVLVQ